MVDLSKAIYNHWRTNVTRNDLWAGSQHRGNCYLLWDSILHHLELHEKVDMRNDRIYFTAPIRTLAEWSAISSMDTLTNCIATLDELGLIEVIDRGLPDSYETHPVTCKVVSREKGRAASYAVRLSERSSTTTTSISSQVGNVVEEDVGNDWVRGAFRLPNAEFIGSDLAREEPHLLRSLDLMAIWGERSIELSARVLAGRLGLAVSSCHQMIHRWISKRIVSARRVLDRRRPDWMQPRRDKLDRVVEVNQRSERRRDRWLKGVWMKKYQRKAQRMVLMPGPDGFDVIDWKWSREIEKAQDAGVGWLDPGEMLRAWYDSRFPVPA